MNLEILEKELDKYKKVASGLEREIAVTEDRLQTVIDDLKRDFDIETLVDGEKSLEALGQEIDELEKQISKQMEELKANYGNLK